MSDAFKQRVRDEVNALGEKVEKLAAFCLTSAYAALPAAERARLRVQHTLMTGYAQILHARVAADFK